MPRGSMAIWEIYQLDIAAKVQGSNKNGDAVSHSVMFPLDCHFLAT